jgi:hypothetical protein
MVDSGGALPSYAIWQRLGRLTLLLFRHVRLECVNDLVNERL